MRFLSVCSGIEAASVAWQPLGWEAAAFSEIEAFPRAVLRHRFPDVPLHGDFTTIRGDEYGSIGLLCGGTPCQSFSIAGLRKGMDDDRGNLALEFLRLAQRTGAKWLLWENVPGVLSSNGGRDFGSILGGLGQCGYGFAYRVLDAQFFGVPQRRRRVFLVGYLGDWRPAAAVLFERHSMQGHPAPRRETREAVAALTANGVGTCGADDNQGQAGHLIPDIVGQAMSAKWSKGSSGPAGDEHHNLIAFSAKDYGGDALEDLSPTLRAGAHSGSHANAGVMPAVAFAENTRSEIRLEGGDGQRTGALTSGGGKPGQGSPMIADSAVRRLTPRECERLQGFPDDWTLVPYRGRAAEDCPDGPRYKALGNSWAVPCARWIGERIQMVEGIINGAE